MNYLLIFSIVLFTLISLLCGVDLYPKGKKWNWGVIPTLDPRFVWPYIISYGLVCFLLGISYGFWATLIWVALAAGQWGVSYILYRYKNLKWCFWGTVIYHAIQIGATLLLILL